MLCFVVVVVVVVVVVLFSVSQTHPKWKENSDLNASGQISLSCHKEVIKLIHYAQIVWNPRIKVEQGTGDQHNPANS